MTDMIFGIRKLATAIPFLFLLYLPIQATAETEMYFVHNDHLGRPEAMTDKDQNVVWRAKSKPFGKTEVNGSVDEHARFPGQFFDDESKLHYNYFRYYDPSGSRRK